MKVLVTGGAGFIGSNIVGKLLSMGHEVRVLDNMSNGSMDNLSEYISNDSLEVMIGDIDKYMECRYALHGIDVVCHQAAYGSVPRSIRIPEMYSQTNVHGFVNLCTAAEREGIKRIVYASSSSVYGDSPKEIKYEMDATIYGKPLSPYAASKISDEMFAHSFANSYGITLVGFRYFNVYGPKQMIGGEYAAVIPCFAHAILCGEDPVIFGDGTQVRDFTYVDNVVDANIRGLFNDIPQDSHVVNIACGEKISINELYANVKSYFKTSIDAKHQDTRKGDIHSSMASISRAKDILGYEPLVKVSDGIKKTLDWYTKKPSELPLS